ncbi:MAG TPA: S-adenosyl-l-methionine hydroxide adenosyltransferase family protein, partial [Opitutaceae bacterium]|nr:S-adenosyl-l-methionine hydroxide adenosyltransferase family protein [Opitutaceae bacterium]
IYDLSHENTPFDIWEGAYRLNQTARYWPTGTVFVSVIDPGVGTDRASIVLKTKTGHYFVSPDNGTLTLVAEELGIEQVRQIDETVNRLPGSEKSYTFHGRDVYAYTGARLAAGKITFEQIGPARPPQVITLAYEKARIEQGILVGTIPFLDFQYGNVWTNIGDDLFRQLKPVSGDRFRVTIFHGKNQVYQGEMPYAKTFGDVPEGSPLLYLNSLLNVSFAINVGSFVKMHNISSGADWSVRVEKLSPTR